MTWTYTQATEVTAYLWGGGGGAGGNDGVRVGGAGSGGGFATVNFSLSPGDVIDVVVGRHGGGGGGRAGNAPGGSAGPSLLIDVFNSRNPPAQGPAVYPITDSYWSSFLNSNAVWESNAYASNFVRTYTLNFPVTGWYYWRGQCDNYAEFRFDGNIVLTSNDYRGAYSETFVYATAGTHIIELNGTNTGGPGGIALTINMSYSGGAGGNAGPAPSSGAGGGSGGSSLVLLNNQIVAVAGGGAGGGGAGYYSDGGTASSNAGQLATSITNGQNGQSHPGDGGGAGAGASGQGAGIGGTIGGYGDVGGSAGSFGLGAGDLSLTTTNRIPPQTTNPYYFGSVGYGGAVGGTAGNNGQSGLVVLVFNFAGTYINDGNSWTPITQTYIMANNDWKQVKGIWIKDNDQWKPVVDNISPVFNTVAGRVGVLARPAIPFPPAPPEF